MQRRHFELIADVLSYIKEMNFPAIKKHQHEIIVGLFASRLKETNELFDAERFKKAAGVRDV